MSTIYFITHPDVDIDPSIPVTEWSLSVTGIARMHNILLLDWINSVEAIYCSAEKKAKDGATIISDKLQLPFKEIEALGENDRSATGYLPSAEFEHVADQFFATPSQSTRGWETAKDAQARIVQAIQQIVKTEDEARGIAIISHGAVGTLLLCHLNNWAISRKHDQPGNGGGHYFSFESNLTVVHHGWRAIDAKAD